MTRNSLTLCLALVLVLVLVPLRADADDDNAAAIPEAVEAAKSWLSLTDAGDYETSWERSAELFRQAVTKEQWSQALNASRGPLGSMQTREVKSTQYATSLPGAPDGHYVVIQFTTSFANKQEATETVTPMRDPDGVWRVSGYYIK